MDFTKSELAYLITSVNSAKVVCLRNQRKQIEGSRLYEACSGMLMDLDLLHDRLVTEYQA